MAKCPSCCPNGGAIFRMGFGWRGEAQYNYAMTCQNCGYQRKKQNRKPAPDYAKDELTEQQVEKLNRWALARYHLLNPNGLIHGDLAKLSDRINRAIEAGVVKGGFWLVYGSMGYHGDQLHKLAFQKKLRVWDVNYHINGLRKQIAEGNAKLDELGVDF